MDNQGLGAKLFESIYRVNRGYADFAEFMERVVMVD
jgi:hypothetical protein